MMIEQNSPHVEFARARDELRRLGVNLEVAPGEFRVSLVRATLGDAFFSDELAEAIDAGRRMAETFTSKPAPLGPCGRRNTRRALMYRHNTMLATIRRGGKERT
jgi:hypothetical protein